MEKAAGKMITIIKFNGIMSGKAGKNHDRKEGALNGILEGYTEQHEGRDFRQRWKLEREKRPERQMVGKR